MVCVLALVECFENVWEVIVFDACSGVGHSDDHIVIVASDGHLDATICRGEFQRVRHQVADNVGNVFRYEVNFAEERRVERKRDVAAFGIFAVRVDYFANER